MKTRPMEPIGSGLREEKDLPIFGAFRVVSGALSSDVDDDVGLRGALAHYLHLACEPSENVKVWDEPPGKERMPLTVQR